MQFLEYLSFVIHFFYETPTVVPVLVLQFELKDNQSKVQQRQNK